MTHTRKHYLHRQHYNKNKANYRTIYPISFLSVVIKTNKTTSSRYYFRFMNTKNQKQTIQQLYFGHYIRHWS